MDVETREEAEGKRIMEMLELVAAHKHRWETFKLQLRRIRLETQHHLRTPVAPSQSSREPSSLGAGVPVSQNQVGLQVELLANGVYDPPRTANRCLTPAQRAAILGLCAHRPAQPHTLRPTQRLDTARGYDRYLSRAT
jgi:hypothetical protein